MKKMFVLLMLIGAMHGLQADVQKGQRFYLKHLKTKVKMNGADFVAQYTQREWEKRFADHGQALIEELSRRYPRYRKFFHSRRFRKKMPHLYDFAHTYAKDSGKTPSCGQDVEPDTINLVGQSQQNLF